MKLIESSESYASILGTKVAIDSSDYIYNLESKCVCPVYKHSSATTPCRNEENERTSASSSPRSSVNNSIHQPRIMPWQVVPSLAIIVSMVNLTAFGLWGTHRLFMNKVSWTDLFLECLSVAMNGCLWFYQNYENKTEQFHFLHDNTTGSSRWPRRMVI